MWISFSLPNLYYPVLSDPFKTDICLGSEHFYDFMYLAFIAFPITFIKSS